MNKKGQTGIIIALILVVIIVIGFLAWGIPKYNVYSKELSGKAQLKEAEWNRQIAIQEAEAEKASATLKAEAGPSGSGICFTQTNICNSLIATPLTFA